MSFEELTRFYKENFSIGFISNNLDSKLALVSLICYVVYKQRQKYPLVTYYQVISQISKNIGLTEAQKVGLSIVCEDFGYGCSEFPTFGLKGAEIINKIKELLSNELPF